MEGDAFKVLLEAISGLDLANYKEAKNEKKGSLVANDCSSPLASNYPFFWVGGKEGRMKVHGRRKNNTVRVHKLNCPIPIVGLPVLKLLSMEAFSLKIFT